MDKVATLIEYWAINCFLLPLPRPEKREKSENRKKNETNGHYTFPLILISGLWLLMCVCPFNRFALVCVSKWINFPNLRSKRNETDKIYFFYDDTNESFLLFFFFSELLVRFFFGCDCNWSEWNTEHQTNGQWTRIAMRSIFYLIRLIFLKIFTLSERYSLRQAISSAPSFATFVEMKNKRNGRGKKV